MRHVREAFGQHGPPSAFPLPATARKEALRKGGDGIESPPRLMRMRVGMVSVDVNPPATGEALCRNLLVR